MSLDNFYRDIQRSGSATGIWSPFQYQFKEPRPAAASLQALLDWLHHRPGEEPAPWLLLIQDGDLEGFRAWLNGGKNRHKVRDQLGTALEHAVDEWQWEFVCLLVERGASATEAFEHALRNYRYPIARRLLTLGVEASVLRESLIQLAHPFWHDPELVAALLAAGANPNYQDRELRSGDRPLHCAAAAGNVESVRLLLAHGARRDAVNGDGKRPADFAAAAGHTACAELLRSPDRPKEG